MNGSPSPIRSWRGAAGGALAGNVIDHALLGGNSARTQQGPRLSDLGVMASTEGAPIRGSTAGAAQCEVIWATRLEEVMSTRMDSSGGGNEGRVARAETFGHASGWT